jgi:uncharacterized protein (UPF0335 family)
VYSGDDGAPALTSAPVKRLLSPGKLDPSRREVAMSTAAAVKQEERTARFAKDHLKAFVERIERLEEEKKAIAGDVRDVYAEAKANGFDTKALRAIVRLRGQDAEERREHETIVETYMHALGMP